MKEVKLLQVIAGLVLGGLVIYLLCCRHKCPEHIHGTVHNYKIWKGNVEILDDSIDSGFTGLRRARFLNDTFYVRESDVANFNPIAVSYVHIAKVPSTGSPFIPSVAGDDTINILHWVPLPFMDENLEFLRCRTTGKVVCIPDWKILPDDTTRVIKQGESEEKILLRLQTFVHETDPATGKMIGNQWEYAEFTEAEYKRLLDNLARGGEGTCLSLVFDEKPVDVKYSDGVARKAYKKPIFR